MRLIVHIQQLSGNVAVEWRLDKTAFGLPLLSTIEVALCILLGFLWSPSVKPEWLGVLLLVLSVSMVFHHSCLLGYACVSTDSACTYLLVVCLLFQFETALLVSLLGLIGSLSLRMQFFALAVCSLAVGVFRRNVSNAVSRLTFQLEKAFPGIALIAFTWVVTSFNQVRYTVIEADSMWYHLPMVAEWIQSGSIWPSDTIYILARAYPGFRESILTFLSIPLHQEHLALLAALELPVFALSMIALGLLFSSSRAFVVAVAAYATTVPAVVAGLTTQKNDLSLAIFLSTSVYFALLAVKNRNSGNAILAGMSLGALAATKFSGIIYAGAVIGILLLAQTGEIDRGAERSRGRISLLRVWSLIVIGALCVGGPWYLRNIIAYGNPLYPAEIGIGRWILLNGPMARDALKAQTLGWNVWPLFQNLNHFIEAFGVLIPAIVLGALASLGRWRLSRSRTLVIPALLAGFCFVAFLHQPFNLPNFGFGSTMRYLLPWFAMSLIAVIAGVGESRFASGLAWLFLAGTVVNLASWTQWWMVGLVLALCSLAVRRIISRKPLDFVIADRMVLCSLCVLLVLAVNGVLLVNRVKANYQYDSDFGYKDSSGDRGWGAISTYVHRNIEGKRIVVHGSIDFFPLYGDHLSNRIFSAENINDGLNLVTFARAKNADYIITFVPAIGRSSATEFTYGKSLGADLIKEFPERVSLIFEHQGAYVLQLKEAGEQKR